MRLERCVTIGSGVAGGLAGIVYLLDYAEQKWLAGEWPAWLGMFGQGLAMLTDIPVPIVTVVFWFSMLALLWTGHRRLDKMEAALQAPPARPPAEPIYVQPAPAEDPSAAFSFSHWSGTSKDEFGAPVRFERIRVTHTRPRAATKCRLSVMEIRPSVENLAPSSPVTITHHPGRTEVDIPVGLPQDFDLCARVEHLVPHQTALVVPGGPHLTRRNGSYTLTLRFTGDDLPRPIDLRCVLEMDDGKAEITELERLASDACCPCSPAGSHAACRRRTPRPPRRCP